MDMENLPLEALGSAIESKSARIGILGAGYVGLPLACAFAQAGFETIAGDNDPKKVLAINHGSSYVDDDYVSQSLPRLVASKALRAEGNATRVASLVDFAIITVPTPLSDKKEPDLSHVTRVTEAIAREIRPGRFVILESTVYPGTTDEVLKPILERTGLRAGKDFGLAHSPERIDYGNKKYPFLEIPKVVGGVTPLCTRIAGELYAKVIEAPVIRVSDARTAEATKMLENTYRYVNIALANELAILHEKLGIDFFEVIAAASTKPFGFQPFYPGLGVGGHCIPKDPHYLAYKARQVGGPLRFVELSAEINDSMIDHIVGRLEQLVRSLGRSIRGSKVTILGLAFKPDVSDFRRSPSIALVDRLMGLGMRIVVYDPLVKSIPTKRGELTSSGDLDESVSDSEILVLSTPHTIFRQIDLRKLVARMCSEPIIVDAKGFWSSTECESAGFRYIGLGRP